MSWKDQHMSGPTSKVDISLFTDFAGNNNRAMFVFMPERELVGT